MLIREVLDTESVKLAALSQFLLGRAKDTTSKKEISIQAFINIAAGLGLNITPDQLKMLVQQPPLSEIIANVSGDGETGVVVFKGQHQEKTDTDVDTQKGEQRVDKMAKRAMRHK